MALLSLLTKCFQSVSRQGWAIFLYLLSWGRPGGVMWRDFLHKPRRDGQGAYGVSHALDALRGNAPSRSRLGCYFLVFSGEHEAVGDGEEDGGDARVFCDFLVEGSDGVGGGVVVVLVGDFSGAEHVVEDEHAAGLEEF
jgi:hypothetical protein